MQSFNVFILLGYDVICPRNRNPIIMKNCILFSCAVLCTFIANAQFNFGLKAVVNASSIKIDGNSYDARIGFAGGPYAEYYLSRELGVTAEVLYNEKGAREMSTGAEIKTNLNYLSIPILFYFEPVRNLKLGLGPELAFLLSAKAKGDSINTVDIKKYFQSFDKAIAFGGSYSFGRVGFTARYVAGFDGITNITYTDPDSGNEMTKKTGRNNVIQFAISLRLNKTKYKSVKENQ
jgi:outer membrane immunogenic protein